MEYCDILFLEACDVGRCSVVRRPEWGGDVINGGRDGWLGLDPGDETFGGEFGGGEFGDIICAMIDCCIVF